MLIETIKNLWSPRRFLNTKMAAEGFIYGEAGHGWGHVRALDTQLHKLLCREIYRAVIAPF